MRKFNIFLIIFFLMITLSATERGLTNRELAAPEKISSATDKAADHNSEITRQIPEKSIFGNRDWELIQILEFDTYVHPGNYLGCAYNGYNHTLEFLTDHNLLIPEALEALALAPVWIRSELECTLSQLNEISQEVWAEVINSAEHPFVDEIAYSVAKSSPQFLSAAYAQTGLFSENAQLIYQHDTELDYVQVVDYGVAGIDEDYYSTTRYWKLDENQQMIEIEVPRDIYYMYLVHPKNTDEIPAYIDPDVIEDNLHHDNNIADPPAGVFWRDFLFNHHDEGYPLLKDYLADCEVVWNGSNLDPGNAIGAISTWLAESLVFTSNIERPHQPVRIYRKHIGRCGEHADMRSAAARAALIPCTSILSISGDHTWNEFWDETWVHWDSPDVNNPLVYENGWGKIFASVFEIRSDGLLTPVTTTYSEGSAEISVFVFDSQQNPVDGARILLGVGDGSNILADNVGFTDNQGKYTFIVGEGRTYFAKVSSELGNTPDYLLLIETAQDGESYEFSFNLEGEVPQIFYTEISAPEDDLDDYLLEIDFSMPSQIIHGRVVFDDVEDGEFYAASDQGAINIFMLDLVEFSSYAAGIPFSAFNSGTDVSDGSIQFNIPEPLYGYWYLLFDNSTKISNPQYLTGSVNLYQYSDNSADPELIKPVQKIVNYPNPFNPVTTIAFELLQQQKVEVKIFNLRGELLELLANDILPAGSHEIVWDSSDFDSGIYFYELQAGEGKIRKKMCLLK